jgi:hypothetical protein
MYTLLGSYPVIPAAELLDLQSAANRPGVGNSRTGSVPQILGKKAGLLALRDSSGVSLVFALGDKSSDGWRVVDGSATYSPVNVNPAAGGFTIGADSTYAANLLTTDAGNDVAGRAFQTIALKAGKYRMVATIAGEGASDEDYVTARLRIKSGAVTAGVGATDVVTQIVGSNEFIHATAAESLATKQEKEIIFTLATDLSVTFTIDVVDEAGALAAGSAYIALSILEAA